MIGQTCGCGVLVDRTAFQTHQSQSDGAERIQWGHRSGIMRRAVRGTEQHVPRLQSTKVE